MVVPPHPRWGRVIGSYSLSSDVNGANLSLDAEIAGVEAMKKISRLATNADASSWSGSDIKISTLECALRLTQDPTQIQHLANPPVVSGCILLMKTIAGRASGTASPFNYEFGYLCFRLLVATLNVCLLDIWNRLDEVLVRRDQFPHAAAHVLVSIEVSSAVHKQFENLVNGGDCDSFLGWSTPHSRRGPQQATLLLRSEVETLLDILWVDRKLFLRALMLDVPIASGLSGLLLLFARCVAQERDSQQNPNGSTLKKKLYELALRYYLVQDSSQIGPTLNVISSNACYGDWISIPKHVDAEDSRSIMTAFIKRLSECSDPAHLIMEDASMMLRFVPLAIDAQTQDLLPEVLKHSVEYGWLVLLAQEDKDEIRLLVNTLLPSLTWLISPPHNRPYRLAPSTQDQIIDTIHEGALLDWVACAMYKLDPSALGERSLQGMDAFFRALSKAIPTSKLQEGFWDYTPDWRKFYRHIKATGSSVNTPSQRYYNACLQTWYQIAQFLGLEQGLYVYGLIDCFNGRCPRAYTNDADGPRVACASCKNAVYCNDRCQSTGWRFGDYGVNPPHRVVCGP